MRGKGGENAHSPPRITVTGVLGIPEIEAGARLGTLIAKASTRQGDSLRDGDIVVVTQKVVSKAEGRLVRLDSVAPSPYAVELSADSGRDPRLTELVLRESASVVRMDTARGIMITETKHGFICANAGIDSSNVAGEDVVSLLPEDPDESARGIRAEIKRETDKSVAVVITDTFGRPWREGQTNYAIGAAGIEPLVDYRGGVDAVGKLLKVTMIAVADELAAAAELVMAKAAGIPVAIVRGYEYREGAGSARSLLRERSLDLFR